MKFENVKVWGFEGALRGMRFPMQSNHLSDSWFGIIDVSDEEHENNVANTYENVEEAKKMLSENCWLDFDVTHQHALVALIGAKDMKLAIGLDGNSREHAKFMRSIFVHMDVSAPRFIWSEFDTYHNNTKNSESTMHKLLNNKNQITMEQFEVRASHPASYARLLNDVDTLEQMRKDYSRIKNMDNISANGKSDMLNNLLLASKEMLPESFIQKRFVSTNYEELRAMYLQRKNHRLPQWNTDFVEFIKTLPYAKQLIIGEDN